MSETGITEIESVWVDNDRRIRIFRIEQGSVTAEVCALGAGMTCLLVPTLNADGGRVMRDDVVLGFGSVKEMYETRNPVYFGVVPGRVANRIKKGQFRTETDGKVYQADINNDPNSLHGGFNGLSTQIWDAEIVPKKGADRSASVRFSLLSRNGEGGYPGTVRTSVTYSLQPTPSKESFRLCVDMEAELLDEVPSPVNLTQHSYFNLAGHAAPEGILEHALRLYCDAYTPVDSTSIPTREVRKLSEDRVMDWRSSRSLHKALGDFGVERAGLSREQVDADLSQRGGDISGGVPYGFDHNYVVRQSQMQEKLSLVAVLRHAGSRRRMTVRSTAPGVQLYTANYLDGTLPSTMKPSAQKTDVSGYCRWQGLCLETQNYPDSILVNSKVSPDFAQGQCQILTPESPLYRQSIEYTFECDASGTPNSSMTGFHGTDSDNNHYYSVENMWEEQDVANGNAGSWYERAACYYKENCPSTIDGVLGGFASITETDLAGSIQFIRELEIVRPSVRSWSSGSRAAKTKDHQKRLACECGAGLGRVTKGLLLQLEGIEACDLVESSSTLLSAAPEYLGDSAASRCRFFCNGLQEWEPARDTYSLLWVQWVLSYLTDDDIVKFLQRCGESLVEDGVIVLKENTCAESDFVVDNDDASVTRSLRYWKCLVERAGLRIFHEKAQDSLPDDIYPVPMLACSR